jgi:anti-sigma B factor antagonist
MLPVSSFSDLPNDQLSLRSDHDSDTATVRIIVSGEVDGVSCDELRRTFSGAVVRHRPAVVDMDVAGVTFLGSTGIRTLVECQAEAAQSGCTLVLTEAPRTVLRVLEICGLLEHFGLPAAPPAGPAAVMSPHRAG